MAELWSAAAGIASPAGLSVDGAIDVAVQLVVSGDQRDEVWDVAALSPGTSQAVATEPVIRMLVALNIDIARDTAAETDRVKLMFKAFAHGGLSIEQFEGYWWPALPAYDLQTDAQQRVTGLLDERDHLSGLPERAAAADEIRHVLLVDEVER